MGIEDSWTQSDYPFADARLMNSGSPWPQEMEFPNQSLAPSRKNGPNDVEFYFRNPAFSPSAFRAIESSYSEFGEFWPIVIENTEYKLFNSYSMVGQSSDPLNLDVSNFDGSRPFRLTNDEGDGSYVCITSSPSDPAHDLYEIFRNNNWTGVVFREIWPQVPNEMYHY